MKLTKACFVLPLAGAARTPAIEGLKAVGWHCQAGQRYPVAVLPETWRALQATPSQKVEVRYKVAVLPETWRALQEPSAEAGILLLRSP